MDERYERLWGWTPGVNHTVVFFGFRDDGKTEVGDPAVGREHWRVEDVRVLWHGEGIRLVARSDRWRLFPLSPRVLPPSAEALPPSPLAGEGGGEG